MTYRHRADLARIKIERAVRRHEVAAIAGEDRHDAILPMRSCSIFRWRKRGDLARGGTVVIDLEGEPARLRGVGVDDALPDRRAQHRRIVIGQRLGRLASDDERAPQRLRTNRAARPGR